eukprot:3939286-Lingulodinium_polyedra.AAC.1
MAAADLTKCRLPDPIVRAHSVLEANFDLAEHQSLPHDALDALRTRRSIYLTGFNLSTTRLGDLYRGFVLLRGAWADDIGVRHVAT